MIKRPNFIDALSYGAPVGDVATASGLTPPEVAAGLRSWADGQHQRAGMPAAERDEVYALVDGVEVEHAGPVDAAAVAADDALVEHLRAAGAPGPGGQIDEMLARWGAGERAREQARRGPAVNRRRRAVLRRDAGAITTPARAPNC